MKILSAISPTLLAFVKEAIVELWKRAKATPNPVDDFFAAMLCQLVGIDPTKEKEV